MLASTLDVTALPYVNKLHILLMSSCFIDQCFECMNEIMGKSQINVQIIIMEPYGHVGQPIVAFILPNIMIKLPVATMQVLMSNPVPS